MATKSEEIDLTTIDPAAFFTAQREKWKKQAEEARAKLDEANGWLAKFDAFEGKKSPQPDFLRPAPAAKRGSRASGDSAKAKVLALIKEHPDGISADQISKAFPDMKSLGNVLSTLKVKDKLITQEGRGNPYFPASSEAEAA